MNGIVCVIVIITLLDVISLSVSFV